MFKPQQLKETHTDTKHRSMETHNAKSFHSSELSDGHRAFTQKQYLHKESVKKNYRVNEK